MPNTEAKGLNISTKSFLTSILVIFLLMILTYLLTIFLPTGSYNRIHDSSGNLLIDTISGFSYVEGGISFWKWLLSPILVLTSSSTKADS